MPSHPTPLTPPAAQTHQRTSRGRVPYLPPAGVRRRRSGAHYCAGHGAARVSEPRACSGLGGGGGVTLLSPPFLPPRRRAPPIGHLRSHPSAFWVNPYGLAFDLITASSLLLVSHDGEVLEGGYPGNGQLYNAAGFTIHGAIHAARPDIHAAAHSHSQFGRAFSALGRNIDIANWGELAGWGVAAARERSRWGGGGRRVGGPEIAVTWP